MTETLDLDEIKAACEAADKPYRLSASWGAWWAERMNAKTKLCSMAEEAIPALVAEVERLQAANLRIAGVCASQAGELAVLYREYERYRDALQQISEAGRMMADAALSPVATPPAGDPHSKDGE